MKHPLRNAVVSTALAVLGGVAVLGGSALASTSHHQVSPRNSAGTYNIVGGKDGHSDGVATISNNAGAGTVTITLAPNSGLSFSGGFVCIGDASTSNPGTSYFTAGTGFSDRINPGNDANGCPPSGPASSFFVLQQFSNGGPWVVSVPSSFFADGMFLQIHVSVSNGDTGFPCAITPKKGTWYGNCSSPGGSPLPIGTFGGLGAAAVAGGGLAVVQLRRKRRLSTV